MAKPVLKKKNEPIGDNLYIISVVESIYKGKSILIYADGFEIDDQGLLIFKIADEIIYVIRSGDWKTIQLYEDIEEFEKCVRYMTIEQRLEEIKIMKDLEKEAMEKEITEETEKVLEETTKLPTEE
jgi:hypothetical protein